MSEGSIEGYMAHLIILGNIQVERLDYHASFAPVTQMVMVRTLWVVAAARNWEIHQIDVHIAYLYGDLHKKVYMRLLSSFPTGHEGKVYRLQKSLYGLKKAPHCWFVKLTTALRQYCFRQSYWNYSFFTYFPKIFFYVLRCILMITLSQAIILLLSRNLSNISVVVFSWKILGPLNIFWA